MADALVIDTCGATGATWVISTAEPAEIRVERQLPGRETQERLMTAIAECFEEALVSLAGLDALAVVTGPGSFTGVRIGLAVVKSLAEALHLPVVAISRLRWMAATAFAESLADRSVVAWLDAGRGEVYAGHYVQTEAGLTFVEEALRLPNSPDQGSGETIVVTETNLAERWPGTVLLTPEPLRREMVRLIASSMRDGDFADPVLLDANYLRVPDAELALRARQAAGIAAR